MKEIKSCAIVGMGALGLMYAHIIQKNLGKDAVNFVMDSERAKKYKGQRFLINGMEEFFNVVSFDDAEPVDFVIVAVKFTGLESSLKTIEKLVGPSTVIISVLNGISSEEILAGKFGSEKIIYTVAQAMDAMKSGNDLKYTREGELRIGVANGGLKENLEAVVNYFEKAGIHYTVEDDIIRRLWNKFMCNVGINQTCMVFGKNYSQVIAPGEAHDVWIGAMKEVILISKAEGINLTEEDLSQWIKIISTLDPDGTPSMGQDRLAHRKSEVELFSGTVIKIARKHGLEVPVNQWLYDQVQEIEKGY